MLPERGRLRASRALLDSIGFDRARADRLRKQYLAATSKLLRLGDVRILRATSWSTTAALRR